MPYTGANDPDLPESVKDLPEDKRSQWVAVFNSAYERCTEEGLSEVADNPDDFADCEAFAFANANGVVLEKEERMPEEVGITISWSTRIFRAIRDEINRIFEPFITDRKIKEVDSWDASVWDGESADAYCAACLIDVNSAAGRDEKVKSHCKLPVREPGDSSDTYVDKAVHAAAGGARDLQVEETQ